MEDWEKDFTLEAELRSADKAISESVKEENYAVYAALCSHYGRNPEIVDFNEQGLTQIQDENLSVEDIVKQAVPQYNQRLQQQRQNQLSKEKTTRNPQENTTYKLTASEQIYTRGYKERVDLRLGYQNEVKREHLKEIKRFQSGGNQPIDKHSDIAVGKIYRQMYYSGERKALKQKKQL
ncbi:MAG: hypothetical protein ACQESC_03095 [Nanobdellota archaeon]